MQRAAAKDSKQEVVPKDEDEDDDEPIYVLGPAGKKHLVDSKAWQWIQIPVSMFVALKELVDTYESQPADDIADAKGTEAAQKKMSAAIGGIFLLLETSDELKMMSEQVMCPKGLKKPQAAQFHEKTFSQILGMITQKQICNHATGEAMLAIMSLFIKL